MAKIAEGGCPEFTDRKGIDDAPQPERRRAVPAFQVRTVTQPEDHHGCQQCQAG